MSRVLILDNYDSFTHNLYQFVGSLGAAVDVRRNDAIDLDGIRAWEPTHLILSPGPGHPSRALDFGICADAVKVLAPELPTLGVCLGHQGIVHHLGGRVIGAPTIEHGKIHSIRHDGRGVFAGLDDPLDVMRYHSLCAERASLPDCLEVTAESSDGVIQGVRHRDWPLEGVQFHPESIGTPQGLRLLANFIGLAPDAEEISR